MVKINKINNNKSKFRSYHGTDKTFSDSMNHFKIPCQDIVSQILCRLQKMYNTKGNYFL